MKNQRETPEDKRERLRQEELKRNPSGSIHGSELPDLVGGLSWKGTAILIGLLILGFVLYIILFK